jgi:hypothetical protein
MSVLTGGFFGSISSAAVTLGNESFTLVDFSGYRLKIVPSVTVRRRLRQATDSSGRTMRRFGNFPLTLETYFIIETFSK